MNLIPWRHKQSETALMEPPLSALRGEVDRLFDTFLREPFGLDFPTMEFLPAVDVVENDDEITVRAELPGINPKDVDVSLSGNQLILSGEKKHEKEEKRKGFHRSEIQFGSFRRVIPLPEGIDPDKVEAHFADGLLTLHVKKVLAAAAKRIPIKTE